MGMCGVLKMEAKCKYVRYAQKEGSEIYKHEFTCDDLRANIETWKKEFIDRMIPRASFKEKQDRAVKEYCEELDRSLAQCKCGNPLL